MSETFATFFSTCDFNRSKVESVKKIVIILMIAFVFVTIAFICGVVYFVAPPPPKEANLIQNFNEHRAAFEQLREMLQTDANLREVASWGIETRKPFFHGYPSKEDFPTDRFNKYLVLLKEVGGSDAWRNEGKHPDPTILIWGSGLLVDLKHIEICWLDEPPTNQVPSLEGYLAYSTNSVGVYKHIDHNWYFWTDGFIPATR